MLLARLAEPFRMTTYRAGQEIDSYCTKCKLDLTHKIVAVVGNKPVKVECRTCYGVHNYRAPKSAVAATPTARASSGARASSSRATTVSRAEPEPPPSPPDSARILLYQPSERFAVGAWISHKTFGLGVVLRELATNKIEVRFDADTKVLVHGLTPVS